MARVTYVKKAQPRYRTVPVIDEATGKQKLTPVMGRDGKQKTNKFGTPTFLRVTEADKSQPLPNRKCESCGKEIEVGAPYKWIKPKSGPYGGSLKVRCGDCPTWHVWDYSYSMSARLAQIAYEAGQAFDNTDITTADDVTEILSQAAESIRELAEEKKESASNIEDGFGHETEKSQELNDIAEQLESWADDVENNEVPDAPEPEEEDRWYVVNTGDGSVVFEDTPEGYETADEARAELDAYLEQNPNEDAESFDVEERPYTPDEPTDEQMDEWRDEARSALDIVDESPV